MKRAVLIALGVILLVVGVLVAAAGGAAAALFGSDGAVSTAPARVHGTGVALVIEEISVDASNLPVPEGLGSLTLSVASPSGRSMFVGAAGADAVDTYLTGAPYDVVVELSSGNGGTTRAVPGTQQPAPPGAQSFWARSSSGAPARITATVAPDTSLVVMNADAGPDITADLVVTLTVSRIWTASWVAVGAGVLLVVLGILALWRARVHRRRARDAAEQAGHRHVLGATAATVLPGGAIDDGSTVGPGAVLPDLADAPPDARTALAPPPPGELTPSEDLTAPAAIGIAATDTEPAGLVAPSPEASVDPALPAEEWPAPRPAELVELAVEPGPSAAVVPTEPGPPAPTAGSGPASAAEAPVAYDAATADPPTPAEAGPEAGPEVGPEVRSPSAPPSASDPDAGAPGSSPDEPVRTGPEPPLPTVGDTGHQAADETLAQPEPSGPGAADEAPVAGG